MLFFTRILADLLLMGAGKALESRGQRDRYQEYLRFKAERAKVEEKWRREREEDEARRKEWQRRFEDERIKREQAERARREAEVQRNIE